MSEIPDRPSLRHQFLTAEKRLEPYFYTSNTPKFMQAYLVFQRSGLVLKHFRTRTDPYAEDYHEGTQALLRKALAEVLQDVGASSLLFVEDTSVRIDALSSEGSDVPGLAVKEWFQKTSFKKLDKKLSRLGKGRKATIFSDIALHVPGLSYPLFFHGEVSGEIAKEPPKFPEHPQFPWLTPKTFNGWFVPAGATKRLGEMSLEESWQYDFRTRALEALLNRLEEYTAILNLHPRTYSSRSQTAKRAALEAKQHQIFVSQQPVLIVIGKACAGKSTFGERAQARHEFTWLEASDVLRTFKNSYDRDQLSGHAFAEKVLEEMGNDVVARTILQTIGSDGGQRIVVSGFRTMEELETMNRCFPRATVVLIEASERARYQRHRARGRAGHVGSSADFREDDAKQRALGLLGVAEEVADVRITNERTLEDYWEQIDAYIATQSTNKVPNAVTHTVGPKDLEANQLYKCLTVLADAGHSLSCDEIEAATSRFEMAVRHNNANKVLKKYPELARRFDVPNERVRYEATNAGRTFVRIMAKKATGREIR